MRLDCEAKYVTEEDPWGIGQADSARYDLYVNAIRKHARGRESVLDVGCGFGAMLARLQPDFKRLHGIELSAVAVSKGIERYPFITFEQGSIDALWHTSADRERFDAIVFSDVLYYVEEPAKRASLRWIAEHLRPDGLAFIAAYSPRVGEYPTPAEIRALVERELVIESEELLDSDHMILLARARRRLAALTLDYETWQPVPAGRRIDWETDVFEPTGALMDACEAEGARLTIFAELGEHAFLREHQPELAARMEGQWREAVQRGHGVQMHLHPNWLPELGARLQDGRYVWNEMLTRAEDHPDLVRLIGALKQTLEDVIRPVDPSYEVLAFRAGGYEAQPFRRVAEALRANKMWCDSSVYDGGGRPGQYHRYSHVVDAHQPWFASHVDPQLAAPPAEHGILELPVATFARNDRWTFDAEEGARFGERLVAAIDAERRKGPSIEVGRLAGDARRLLGSVYHPLRAHSRLVNRVLPRRVAHGLVGARRERLLEDDFYVAVGHCKADLDIPAIRRQLRVLREAGVEVVRLAEMAQLAREQLEHGVARGSSSNGRRAHPVGRSAPGLECEEAQSRRLQAMIPLDRTRVLELGCGSGASAACIASKHPWMRVSGVDADERSIAAACEQHAREGVDFAVADFLALPFSDGTFDCIYADNALQHAEDVDATLAEARRVLTEGGVLIAAIPPEAYNAAAGRHTWRTSPEDVRERLRHARFVDITVEEIDTYRLGGAPYPPALDRLLYIRAWRRVASLPPLERIDALLHWTHSQLDPSRPSASRDPAEMLRRGHADRAGMAIVLGEALVREGYDPRWITMIAQDHPAGSGPSLRESHEAIELTLADQSVHVLDPMADVRFPCSLQTLIDEPTRADGVERSSDLDYTGRPYDLYSTSFWYGRVVAVSVRNRRWAARHFVPARWADRALLAPYRALAFVRVRAWRAIRALGPVRLPTSSTRRGLSQHV